MRTEQKNLQLCFVVMSFASLNYMVVCIPTALFSNIADSNYFDNVNTGLLLLYYFLPIYTISGDESW